MKLLIANICCIAVMMMLIAALSKNTFIITGHHGLAIGYIPD